MMPCPASMVESDISLIKSLLTVRMAAGVIHVVVTLRSHNTGTEMSPHSGINIALRTFLKLFQQSEIIS